jgi:diacylglycerol kinase (ATP)
MNPCIIFNPTARGEKARVFQKHLTSMATKAAIKPTTGPGTARTLAAEAVNEGFDVIVAAGGDGTVNEVLNGLGDAPDGFARAALAVLPLGTVNVFAKELGISGSTPRAWKQILDGERRQIDLPYVTSSGESTRRYFAQLAGAGLDARAVELVSWSLKKKVGALAYVWAGLQAIVETRPPIEIRANGERIRGEAILIGNGRFYGGRFSIFSQADLRDGRLDAVIFSRSDFASLARCGLSWATKRLGRDAGAVVISAESIQLSAEGPVAYQIDGELGGNLPARFELLPGKLNVIVPARI